MILKVAAACPIEFRSALDDPSVTFLDGTPDYIHIPSAACRIASAFPSAKLVLVLRDPVMRALSQWNMVRKTIKKHKILDFDAEVRALDAMDALWQRSPEVS